MSTLYNLEPQPTAKAVLHTTSGDILLELFAQQTPLTSRNFLQLCLDGYYDNTIFHRLVPNFIIQGGDPTGTGSGGESSHDGGAPFADEFHSRLKFNRRGVLGMANSGTKDDNGSQFFLTLGNTPELTGRNTMFGRVEGNTIFNLVKMGEADLAEEEGSERPLYPTRITGTEVLVNPFEDMVKRARVAARTTTEVPAKKKPKKKAGKALLSFGGDDGDEPSAIAPLKTAKFNPQLVSAGPDTQNPPLPQPPKRPAPAPSTQDRAPKRRLASRSPSPPTPPTPTPREPVSARKPSPSPTPPQSPPHNPSETLLERTNAQIAALKSSLKRTNIPTASTSSSNHKRSALEAMIPATSTRGRKRKGGGAAGAGVSREEQRALDEFVAFRRKLDAAAASANAPGLPKEGKDDGGGGVDLDGEGVASVSGAGAGVADPVDEEALLCDLHFIAECQSCGRWDAEQLLQQDGGDGDEGGEGDGEGGVGWMVQKLSFERDRRGKDLEWKRQNEKELVVIDPREKERGLGIGEGRRGRGGGRGSVRGGGGRAL